MPKIVIATKRWLKKPIFQLAIVVAIGVMLRYINLAQVPEGLFHDEAWSDVKAMQLNSGEAKPEIYFAENNGMDALHVYAIALLFRFTGPLAMGSRIMSSLAGCLLLVATYWLAHELFFDHAHRHAIGLAAAFVNATLFWALTTSRSGWHAESMALFSSACLAALIRARRLKQWRWFILSGILAGIAQYTYPSARFLLIGLIVLLLIDLWIMRAHWREVLLDYSLIAVAAIAIFAPLAAYFIQHPEWLVERAQQTTDVDLLSNFGRTLSGISFVGDTDNLHNLPGRPALDPILSLFFFVGLISVVWRKPDPARVLLSWLIVFSLPVAFTAQAPLFRRWTGVLSIESILIAIGAVGSIELITGRLRLVRPRLILTVISAPLIGSALLSVVAYFGPFASNPQLFWAYDSGVTQVANYIRDQAASTIFLTPYDRFYEAIDITLAEANRPAIQSYNGATCALFPAVTDRSTQWVVVVEKDDRTVKAIQQLFPSSQSVWQINSPIGVYARAIQVPAGEPAQLQLQNQALVNFDGKIQLIGFSVLNAAERGKTLRITVALKDRVPLDQLYKIFVHVRGSDESIAAQDDRYPCDFTLNQADWKPGNIVLQDFEVPIPESISIGKYSIVLGLYDPDSGTRLPINHSDLAHGADEVTLGAVVVK